MGCCTDCSACAFAGDSACLWVSGVQLPPPEGQKLSHGKPLSQPWVFRKMPHMCRGCGKPSYWHCFKACANPNCVRARPRVHDLMVKYDKRWKSKKSAQRCAECRARVRDAAASAAGSASAGDVARGAPATRPAGARGEAATPGSVQPPVVSEEAVPRDPFQPIDHALARIRRVPRNWDELSSACSEDLLEEGGADVPVRSITESENEDSVPSTRDGPVMPASHPITRIRRSINEAEGRAYMHIRVTCSRPCDLVLTITTET